MQTLIANYKGFLSGCADVLASIEGSKKMRENLGAISSNIDKTELIVPVVGGFSAGKSTIINSFLGQNILPTAITAETALATELRYNETSFYQAIKDSGEVVKFEINESEQIKQRANEFSYLRLYLNNEKLREILPLVLVDMPGFDAPIELHNKAILRYLSEGKYFIVLTSVMDGNLVKSITDELINMNNIGKGFSFCVSKSDLRPKSDVDAVCARIKEQLELLLDFHGEITAIDNESGAKLGEILKQIDSKELFKKIFLDEIKRNEADAISFLDTKIATLKSSKDEIKNAIDELKNKILDLQNRGEQSIKLPSISNISSNIIASVINEISSNSDYLSQVAINNQSNLQTEVNSIVKNTLLREVRENLQEFGKSLIEDFKLDIKDLNLSNFAIGDDWLKNVIDTILATIETAIIAIPTMTPQGGIFKIVAQILQTIISYFVNLFIKDRKADRVKEAIEGQIIPEIRAKLSSEVPIILQEKINEIVHIVSDGFKQKLQQKIDEISASLQKENTNLDDINAKISVLQDAKTQIINLSQKYL